MPVNGTPLRTAAGEKVKKKLINRAFNPKEKAEQAQTRIEAPKVAAQFAPPSRAAKAPEPVLEVLDGAIAAPEPVRFAARAAVAAALVEREGELEAAASAKSVRQKRVTFEHELKGSANPPERRTIRSSHRNSVVKNAAVSKKAGVTPKVAITKIVTDAEITLENLIDLMRETTIEKVTEVKAALEEAEKALNESELVDIKLQKKLKSSLKEKLTEVKDALEEAEIALNESELVELTELLGLMVIIIHKIDEDLKEIEDKLRARKIRKDLIRQLGHHFPQEQWYKPF